MICPKCGHEFKSPVAVAGGKAGGAAKVAKGFAAPAVMRKALATRRRNQKACRHNSVIERISISAPSKPDAGTKEVVP